MNDQIKQYALEFAKDELRDIEPGDVMEFFDIE